MSGFPGGAPGHFSAPRGGDNRLRAVALQLPPSPSSSDLHFLDGEVLDSAAFPPYPSSSPEISEDEASALQLIDDLVSETAALEAELEKMVLEPFPKGGLLTSLNGLPLSHL